MRTAFCSPCTASTDAPTLQRWSFRTSRGTRTPPPCGSAKLLSWVALERAGRIARQRGLPGGNGRWERERDEIYEEIMAKGWNEERNSFVQFYGSDALD